MKYFAMMHRNNNNFWQHVSDFATAFIVLTVREFISIKTHILIIAGPWEKDPHYFKDIQISALALLKMVMHARSGGSLEIMGLLLGKVVENTMVSIVNKNDVTLWTGHTVQP